DVAKFLGWPFPASRAIRETKQLPRPDRNPSDFVNQLRDYIRRGGHDMVIPTDDQTLLAMTDCFEEFKDLTHIACPPPAITRMVLNKTSTLRIAKDCGIRIPRTELVSNSLPLSELQPDFPFPWILKPADKKQHEDEVKSFTLATAEELRLKFPVPKEFSP